MIICIDSTMPINTLATENFQVSGTKGEQKPKIFREKDFLNLGP